VRRSGNGEEDRVTIRTCLDALSASPTLAMNERVQEKRAEGETVYHLGFGESPFPVHARIAERVATYIQKNAYLPALGLPELRRAASAYFSTRLGLEDFPHYLMVGPGSKELIFDVQLAVEGDLLFPVPSWVSYIPQTLITRDSVIKIDTDAAQNYRLGPDKLEAAISDARARGLNPTKLILNYPNNPTGFSYGPHELRALAGVCRRHHILVISDEIYGLVSYRAPHQSIARYYPEGTVVTTGLSKHLSLGGYRLGMALVPSHLKRLIEVLRSIASETFSAVSAPIQFGVMAAFEHGHEVEEYIRECTDIHRIVTRYTWRRIRELGISCGEPEGAFYLYPDFSQFSDNLNSRYGVTTSEELAEQLLRIASVATLPGTAFGDQPSRLRLRISTVDYNGGDALELRRAYPKDLRDVDERAFVERACPRMKTACDRLHSFFG